MLGVGLVKRHWPARCVIGTLVDNTLSIQALRKHGDRCWMVTKAKRVPVHTAHRVGKMRRRFPPPPPPPPRQNLMQGHLHPSRGQRRPNDLLNRQSKIVWLVGERIQFEPAAFLVCKLHPACRPSTGFALAS